MQVSKKDGSKQQASKTLGQAVGKQDAQANNNISKTLMQTTG